MIFRNLFKLYLRVFIKECADIFGPKFDRNLLERGIHFTNAYYGAERFSGSRVVFVNGAIDPWHALSITKWDSEELKQARKTISDTIGKWLQ